MWKVIEISIFSTDFKNFAIYFYINVNCNVSTNTSSDNIEIICPSLFFEVNKTGAIKNIFLDIKIQLNTTRIKRPADTHHTRLHMRALPQEQRALPQEHFNRFELFSKGISRRHLYS